MGISKEESPIFNIKLSSVGPGRCTGQDVVHVPSNMDLAMKLHYLRGAYYFGSQAFQGLTIKKIKEAMFKWLNHYYVACGRFRRSESGRPFVKCNDCGVRIIEAECDRTVEEWLEMKDLISQQKLLYPNQVIGPELQFSPQVLIQITRFKCGGASLGLSWAHVLGDAFCAAEFIDMWGKFMAGHQLSAQSYEKPGNQLLLSPEKHLEDPLSVKRVAPVEDHWIVGNSKTKMETYSFHVSSTQLSRLQAEICGRNDDFRFPPFESLCAVIWQSIAKVRKRAEPKVVTICRSDPHDKVKAMLRNSQVIGVVSADFPTAEAHAEDLALLITEKLVDDRRKIEAAVESEKGLSDLVMYGANLTFVNLEDANFYTLELHGQKPLYVSYAVDGIGDEGVVLVLRTPKDSSEGGGFCGGRIVSITLPENEVVGVKSELKRRWSIT
ncbi:hypothetical protein RJ640_013982 [Escallonia rubra]|uniref:Protein ECERIFERUM 26-like n=1 Tax=Escallonia rubra TaxID=112253 RepID=A0AA88RZF8_9ASTE|nr:hypothetical protein RJ640_013982 [Escallonia rubra]